MSLQSWATLATALGALVLGIWNATRVRKLERRSKLELVGYGVESDDSFRETGGRRSRRAAKRGR